MRCALATAENHPNVGKAPAATSASIASRASYAAAVSWSDKAADRSMRQGANACKNHRAPSARVRRFPRGSMRAETVSMNGIRRRCRSVATAACTSGRPRARQPRSFPIRRSGRRRAPPAILRVAPCAPLARDALKRRFQARWTPFPVRPPVAGSLGSRSSVAVWRRRLATRLRRKRQGRRRRSTSRHGEQRCGDERPRTRVVPAPLSSRHRRARRRAPRRTLGRRAPPMSRIDADS